MKTAHIKTKGIWPKQFSEENSSFTFIYENIKMIEKKNKMKSKYVVRNELI